MLIATRCHTFARIFCRQKTTVFRNTRRETIKTTYLQRCNHLYQGPTWANTFKQLNRFDKRHFYISSTYLASKQRAKLRKNRDKDRLKRALYRHIAAELVKIGHLQKRPGQKVKLPLQFRNLLEPEINDYIDKNDRIDLYDAAPQLNKLATEYVQIYLQALKEGIQPTDLHEEDEDLKTLEPSYWNRGDEDVGSIDDLKEDEDSKPLTYKDAKKNNLSRTISTYLAVDGKDT